MFGYSFVKEKLPLVHTGVYLKKKLYIFNIHMASCQTETHRLGYIILGLWDWNKRASRARLGQ